MTSSSIFGSVKASIGSFRYGVREVRHGPGSALLFALVVLQHLSGETLAQRVARAMVSDVLS